MRTNTVYAEPYPQEVRAAIYCRLSKDDDLSGPSASIQNQRELLCRYCEEQGWRVAGIFQDDGYTGLNMDRPDFQKMLGAVERGMFDVILTKDLSRLGRNYLQTGQLIEEFFPRNKVRYIALNDAAHGGRRHYPAGHDPDPPAVRPVLRAALHGISHRLDHELAEGAADRRDYGQPVGAL